MEVKIKQENTYHETMAAECKTEEDQQLENLRHRNSLKSIQSISQDRERER